MTKDSGKPEFTVESLARELDCDPDVPLVVDVLKEMAVQPLQPHEKPKAKGPKALDERFYS